MEDKIAESNSPAQDTPEAPNTTTQPKKKGKFSFTWVLVIVFALMIANIFRPEKKPEVNWLDYETGIKTAAEQNKPLLIAFYKEGQDYCTHMWADTYANQEMIDFIEKNFVPVYVDVEQQSDLAKEYGVNYYPLHFFKTPDNKEIVKTRRGYDTPGQFKPILLEALEKMNRTPE